MYNYFDFKKYFSIFCCIYPLQFDKTQWPWYPEICSLISIYLIYHDFHIANNGNSCKFTIVK